MTAAAHPPGDDVSPAENDTAVVRSLLHQAARTYASNGVAIFPCRPRDKRPLTSHGFKDATADLDQIDTWWQANPDANIGIALGANRMFALDVDGPDGLATLHDLEQSYTPLPVTYQVATGRPEGEGRHHIFRQPDDRTIGNRQLGDHLETRGDGGYVVAAPSVHPSGRSYEAHGRWADIVDAPRWLVALATKPEPAPAPAPHTNHAGADELAEKRLRGLAGNLAMMGENTGRNNALNHAAYHAGRLVGADRIDRQHVVDVLTTAANRAGLDVDPECGPRGIAATIESGINSGTSDPDYNIPNATTPAPTTIHVDLTTPTETDSVNDTPDGARWQVADAAAILDGTYTQPETTVLTRDDGIALLYPGATNAIFGESESGKSWLALYACCQQLLAGQHAIYIDFEATAPVIILRLAALGAPPEAIIRQFHYIAPDGPVDQDATDVLRRIVNDHAPAIAVIDGITGAMGIHGWDPLSNADTEQFDRLLPRPLAATGAAVLTVDHVPKSKEADSKYAIGGQHKRAAISGAAYRIDVIRPLAPGNHGQLRISISKDRHGTVRAANSTQAGIFHLDSTDPDQPQAHIAAPQAVTSGEDVRPTFLMEKVSRLLEDSSDEFTNKEIEQLVTGKNPYIRKALKLLVDEGYVVRRRDGNSYLNRSARAYRNEENV